MFLRRLLAPLLLCLAVAACESTEEKAQGHYERGLQLLSEGDSARAQIEFRNALKAMEYDDRAPLGARSDQSKGRRP